MFVWVGNMLVTYHDVPDLIIHERLHEYMYVRSSGIYLFFVSTERCPLHSSLVYFCLCVCVPAYMCDDFQLTYRVSPYQETSLLCLLDLSGMVLT